MKPKFKRHFRIYLVNNHPAYIVDEEGNQYLFHRVTKSKSSGGRLNWKVPGENPIEGYICDCYIVKREEKRPKSKFSKFRIKTKRHVNIEYPWIKKQIKSDQMVTYEMRGAHNLMA